MTTPRAEDPRPQSLLLARPTPTRLLAAVLLAATTGLSGVASLQPAVPPTRSHHPDVPYQSPASLGAASYAKILCSAVFVSGRDVDEARKNSAYFLMAEPDRARPVTVDVDRQARRVRVSLQDVTRTAAFYGDQGCVIHPEGHDGVYFTPVPVRTTLPDPASQAWPAGTRPRASHGRRGSTARKCGRRWTWHSRIPKV